MIPAPSFIIPKGMTFEQFLIEHMAEGDTGIRIEASNFE